MLGILFDIKLLACLLVQESRFTPLSPNDTVIQLFEGSWREGEVVDVKDNQVRIKWSFFNKKWCQYESEGDREVFPKRQYDEIVSILEETKEEEEEEEEEEQEEQKVSRMSQLGRRMSEMGRRSEASKLSDAGKTPEGSKRPEIAEQNVIVGSDDVLSL